MLDYLYDIFGKHRTHKTKFSSIEDEAISLIKSYVKGNIEEDVFAKRMIEIKDEFRKLMEVDDKIIFDEDTPLWMNQFFGFKFLRYYRYLQVKLFVKQHREELDCETLDKWRGIQEQHIEKEFLDACKYILREWKRR